MSPLIFDFHFGAAHRVVHRLGAFLSLLPHNHLLTDPGLLRDDRLLGCLCGFDHTFAKCFVTRLNRTVDRAALNIHAFLVQRNPLLHRGLDHVAADPNVATADLTLADDDLLLGEGDAFLSPRHADLLPRRVGSGCPRCPGRGRARPAGPALAAPRGLPFIEVHRAVRLHDTIHRLELLVRYLRVQHRAAAADVLLQDRPVLAGDRDGVDIAGRARPIDRAVDTANLLGKVARRLLGCLNSIEKRRNGTCHDASLLIMAGSVLVAFGVTRSIVALCRRTETVSSKGVSAVTKRSRTSSATTSRFTTTAFSSTTGMTSVSPSCRLCGTGSPSGSARLTGTRSISILQPRSVSRAMTVSISVLRATRTWPVSTSRLETEALSSASGITTSSMRRVSSDISPFLALGPKRGQEGTVLCGLRPTLPLRALSAGARHGVEHSRARCLTEWRFVNIKAGVLRHRPPGWKAVVRTPVSKTIGYRWRNRRRAPRAACSPFLGPYS